MTPTQYEAEIRRLVNIIALIRGLIEQGKGVPPGAALNSLVEVEIDPTLRKYGLPVPGESA